jgi:hypothetical protein
MTTHPLHPIRQIVQGAERSASGDGCRGIGTANTDDYGKEENNETGNGGSR